MLINGYVKINKMQEKELISIIKSTLNSDYIGDDCAYLKDLGIVITQDSLVENVHFKREYTSPFQLGYKSIMVNLSDVASSGAEPSYLTVSLSLPKDIDKNFIKEFYDGCKSALKNGEQIVGGDITGSDKIYISVCAIGKTTGRNISSRKNAHIGYKVVISGNNGSSAAGLKLLQQKKKNNDFIHAHLMPEAQIEFGRKIAQEINKPYAMMDTSDGIMDALATIAKESGVCLEIDFDKIPYDKNIKQFENWEDLVLFGGEDYQILACIPYDYIYGIEIGKVKNGSGIDLKINNDIVHYTNKQVLEKEFNHFK